MKELTILFFFIMNCTVPLEVAVAGIVLSAFTRILLMCLFMYVFTRTHRSIDRQDGAACRRGVDLLYGLFLCYLLSSVYALDTPSHCPEGTFFIKVLILNVFLSVGASLGTARFAEP